jgi:hypothetical protein
MTMQRIVTMLFEVLLVWAHCNEVFMHLYHACMVNAFHACISSCMLRGVPRHMLEPNSSTHSTGNLLDGLFLLCTQRGTNS